MRGHWPAGRRRNDCDATRFILALVTEFGARPLARLAGVSDRTVRRWAAGEDWPTAEAMHRLVDSVFPVGTGALPIYSPDMAIDGGTRVGGVGEFSRLAAMGLLEGEYIDQMEDAA